MEIKEIISSGLLELYALGAASREDNDQVETWIEQYPEVAAEVISIQKAMEEYAFMHVVEPSATLKESIFSEIKNRKPSKNGLKKHEAKVIGMASYLKWAAAASIILLIGSAIFNVIYFNKYSQSETARKEMESQYLAQQEEHLTIQNEMRVVQSKYSEPVSLHGLEAAPDAAAKIFWMKNTGEVYVDPTNLPEAPAGKQYQLWAIVDGKPVDGGMLTPEKKSGKFLIQKMKSFGKAEAFAITLETTGGNPTPKGDMFVMGKI